MRVHWTEHASVCLMEIEEYVAGDDPIAAIRLIARLIERTQILSDHPMAGRRVPELPKSSLRELVEGNYRIVYRVQQESVEILSVFEGHRLFPVDAEKDGGL